MKKISLLFLLSLIVYSCQKNENKKKKWPIATNLKYVEQTADSTSIVKDSNHVAIKLPDNHYAVITLESYTNGEYSFNKPKMIKVFDSKTKQEIPEKWFKGVYYDDNNSTYEGDHAVLYGDFNFDGKMDIACISGYTAYADFNIYNFYLSTANGYELNKSFSEMTENPIVIKLDAKYKKIITERTKEYESSWLYSVKNNTLQLQKPYEAPFSYSSDFGGIETAIEGRMIYNKSSEIEEILTFKIANENKSIMLLRYKDDEVKKALCYAEIYNDTLVNYYYKGKFTYDKNSRILTFKDKSTAYQIIGDDNVVQVTDNEDRYILAGSPKSVKGSLPRITEIKKGITYKNLTIQ